MQNAKKIMISVGTVFCFLSAPLLNAHQYGAQQGVTTQFGTQQGITQQSSARSTLQDHFSLAIMQTATSVQSNKSEVAARFNFEHVRFEFIQLVNDSTLQTPNKRKRIAFSNLV